MTTFLHRIAPDLAIGIVAGSVAGYGLHRLLPATNANFLIYICIVNLCDNIASRHFVNETIFLEAKKRGYVDQEGKITNPLFGRIGLFANLALYFPGHIFHRYVWQRLGYQVPSYLETMGYLAVSEISFWVARTTYEIVKDAYYPKPTTK